MSSFAPPFAGPRAGTLRNLRPPGDQFRQSREPSVSGKNRIHIQWQFQEPKLEVPTIYKAYFLGLCKGISPQNMAQNMVQYLHFRILEFPLTYGGFHKSGYPQMDG